MSTWDSHLRGLAMRIAAMIAHHPADSTCVVSRPLLLETRAALLACSVRAEAPEEGR
jgi:hypothetical protein